MTLEWYEVADATQRLTQGDLIFDCPILSWQWQSPNQSLDLEDTEELRRHVRGFRTNVVVMTQACDLENEKVNNVVLCPHLPLSKFRAIWDSTCQQMGHNPTTKAWKRMLTDLANGYVWNQTFLNACDVGEVDLQTEVCVVDFREVLTSPRSFLESLLQQRKRKRLRLLPPYREHLSQSFARFFMRVGLPQPVELS